jgi:murein DD-endopeptidase MepM/ murein hydrolase activator NlpD
LQEIYVIVPIAANRYATYAHLQNGSIKVHPHPQVHSGDVLGLLENSGNATGPHLHFQLTDGNSVLQSGGFLSSSANSRISGLVPNTKPINIPQFPATIPFQETMT